MRRPGLLVLVLALLFLPLAATLLAGCGGSGHSSASLLESRPAPPRSEFPSARGRTLAEILHFAEGPSELAITPAAEVFYKGENRFPFGVFQRGGGQVSDARVALYLAKVPLAGQGNRPATPSATGGGASPARALGQPAAGPFPAAVETLATKPAFRAKTTAGDPNAALAIYFANLDFPSDGEWRIAALIKQGGKTTAMLLPGATVGEFTQIPRVGQRAPLIHTPTAAALHSDLSKITTRIPPDTQNRIDYAAALGKEPIFLLFATPQFCQSRVCGPVVDAAEQVKHLYGQRAAFIHMEIYKDNDPSKGVRPQVRAFHLPSEPWLFAINRAGRISTAFEGPFGVSRLTAVVKKAIAE